jgi:hypothetical protein
MPHSRHDIDIYAPCRMDEHKRFLLGTHGSKPLFVMGLNPSVADKEQSDHTISRVKQYSSREPYSGFVMLNIYAQRTPYPKDLLGAADPRLHRQNIRYIKSILEKYPGPCIIAAWGSTITGRPYLWSCLTDILHHIQHIPVTWLQIGEKLTSRCHPRHPSRGPYQSLYPFDLQTYLDYHCPK